MTAPALHPSAPITLPPPTSVVGLFIAALAERGGTALAELAGVGVGVARRFGVSPAALDVVHGLPLQRWSHAVAGARVARGSALVWLEMLLPELEGSRTGVGLLLSPRVDQHGSVNAIAVVTNTSDGEPTVIIDQVNRLCPLHRGPPWQDLCAAFMGCSSWRQASPIGYSACPGGTTRSDRVAAHDHAWATSEERRPLKTTITAPRRPRLANASA